MNRDARKIGGDTVMSKGFRKSELGILSPAFGLLIEWERPMVEQET